MATASSPHDQFLHPNIGLLSLTGFCPIRAQIPERHAHTHQLPVDFSSKLSVQTEIEDFINLLQKTQIEMRCHQKVKHIVMKIRFYSAPVCVSVCRSYKKTL
ncbi:hypothetical protein AMECASPLE_029507 [Ameca splendens]|uniref:Uncharacterized protein n=1 Tax=Ameca splendens TaxID=208324 RepID=A0ABV1A1Y7_9TELE